MKITDLIVLASVFMYAGFGCTPSGSENGSAGNKRKTVEVRIPAGNKQADGIKEQKPEPQLRGGTDRATIVPADRTDGKSPAATLGTQGPNWGMNPPKYKGRPFGDVAFLPDAKQLVSASNYGLILWDLETAKVIRVMEESRVMGPIALSGDGKWVLAPFGLWEISTGKLVSVLKPDQNWQLESLALCHDKRYALLAGRRVVEHDTPDMIHGSIQLWDTTNGELVHRLVGNKTSVNSVAFSNDGKLGVSAGWDVDNFVTGAGTHTIKIWDLEKGNLLQKHEIQDPAQVCFSQDDKWIYSFGSKFRAWDVETGALVHFYENLGRKGRPMAYSPDKRYYFTQEAREDRDLDGTLTLWDLVTGKVVKVLERKEDYRNPWIQFSNDGKLVALFGERELLQVWDLETGKMALDLRLPDELRDQSRHKKLGEPGSNAAGVRLL